MKRTLEPEFWTHLLAETDVRKLSRILRSNRRQNQPVQFFLDKPSVQRNNNSSDTNRTPPNRHVFKTENDQRPFPTPLNSSRRHQHSGQFRIAIPTRSPCPTPSFLRDQASCSTVRAACAYETRTTSFSVVLWKTSVRARRVDLVPRSNRQQEEVRNTQYSRSLKLVTASVQHCRTFLGASTKISTVASASGGLRIDSPVNVQGKTARVLRRPSAVPISPARAASASFSDMGPLERTRVSVQAAEWFKEKSNYPMTGIVRAWNCSASSKSV
jgi:hypothetical protein